MAKDPAYLFYTNDFISGTQFFTDEQVGKFIRLMSAQHQHGHLTDKQVLYICKTLDEDIMKKFVRDENNLWYNERLEIEITKRKSFAESRRNNINKRYEKTVEPIKNKKKPTLVETIVLHKENENENENELKIESELSVYIEKFYNFRKEMKKPILNASKQLFLDKLYKLSFNDEKVAINILKQSIANGWQGIFELKNENNGKQTNSQSKQHPLENIRNLAQTILGSNESSNG